MAVPTLKYGKRKVRSPRPFLGYVCIKTVSIENKSLRSGFSWEHAGKQPGPTKMKQKRSTPMPKEARETIQLLESAAAGQPLQLLWF